MNKELNKQFRKMLTKQTNPVYAAGIVAAAYLDWALRNGVKQIHVYAGARTEFDRYHNPVRNIDKAAYVVAGHGIELLEYIDD